MNRTLNDGCLILTTDSFLAYCSTHPRESTSLQHTLTVLAHQNLYNAAKSVIMQKPHENKGIIAHMNCITAAHANDWKRTIPTSNTLELTTAQYRLAARLNLGIDLLPHLNLPSACPLCRLDNNNYLAVDRYHFLSCDSLKPHEVTSRHNAIVGNTRSFLQLCRSYNKIRTIQINGDEWYPSWSQYHTTWPPLLSWCSCHSSIMPNIFVCSS